MGTANVAKMMGNSNSTKMMGTANVAKMMGTANVAKMMGNSNSTKMMSNAMKINQSAGNNVSIRTGTMTAANAVPSAVPLYPSIPSIEGGKLRRKRKVIKKFVKKVVDKPLEKLAKKKVSLTKRVRKVVARKEM
jgi:hypothetical protein